MNNGASAPRSAMPPSTSSVVGSAQCRSSTASHRLNPRTGHHGREFLFAGAALRYSAAAGTRANLGAGRVAPPAIEGIDGFSGDVAAFADCFRGRSGSLPAR
jgi:hypothetical protein